MTQENLAYLKQKSAQLTTASGVYIMKNKNQKIIYIGKAKNLKNRVSSYFRSIDKHTTKVYQMVCHVHDFEYIVTDSEFEALVLECSLIKQHTPKYNILLKDDKGFHYIKIDASSYPKITSVKQQLEDGATYIGPYTSGFVVAQTVDEVNKAFMLPVCTRKFPAEFKKARPCLNFHIKQCAGICLGKITTDEYKQTITQATDFIKGGSSATITLLSGLMERASENLEFEKAIKLRDRIGAIQKIKEHQKVIFTGVKEQDVIAVVKNEKETCIVLLKFRNERLTDKQTYFIGDIDQLATAREQFILQYYENNDDAPKQLLIDGEIDNIEDIKRYLHEMYKKKIDIVLPKRGINTQLIEMARNNAAQQLSHFSEKTGKELSVLDELSKLLNMSKIPVYIEAYDISNIGQGTVVGGMIVFENAKPLKSAYRKFDIKTVSGTNDYACMYEVLERRIIRYFEQDKTGVGFGRLPDLILLDGGKGHVSTIRPLFEKYNFPVPLFGMVKDDKHRTRAIAKDGGEIAILSNRRAFGLISTIQDEVHRFSIGYSTSKHKNTAFELALTKIEGVGKKRAIVLYQHFKTLKAIKEASIEELCMVQGMNKKVATSIHEYLK